MNIDRNLSVYFLLQVDVFSTTKNKFSSTKKIEQGHVYINLWLNINDF